MLGCLAAFIGTFGLLPAPAALGTTLWLYGGTDNSASAGASPDVQTAVSWKDGWVSAQQPDTNLTTSPTAQFNQPDLFGQDASMLLFGFGGTGIDLNEYEVVSARLYFKVDDCFDLGVPLSLGVYGIKPADSGWGDGPSNGATWTGKNGAGTGWTGGATFGASLQNGGLFYGSRTIRVSAADLDSTWFSLDITAAFRDLVSGVNGGIALAGFTNGSTFEGNDTALQIYSDGAGNDLASFKPGLLVEIQKLPAPVTLTALPKGAVKLAVTGFPAGTVVSWTREGAGAIADVKGRYTGATTAALTISALNVDDDGVYRATIHTATGDVIERFLVVLLTQPPVLETPAFPHGQVATPSPFPQREPPAMPRLSPSAATPSSSPARAAMPSPSRAVTIRPCPSAACPSASAAARASPCPRRRLRSPVADWSSPPVVPPAPCR